MCASLGAAQPRCRGAHVLQGLQGLKGVWMCVAPSPRVRPPRRAPPANPRRAHPPRGQLLWLRPALPLPHAPAGAAGQQQRPALALALTMHALTSCCTMSTTPAAGPVLCVGRHAPRRLRGRVCRAQRSNVRGQRHGAQGLVGPAPVMLCGGLYLASLYHVSLTCGAGQTRHRRPYRAIRACEREGSQGGHTAHHGAAVSHDMHHPQMQ